MSHIRCISINIGTEQAVKEVKIGLYIFLEEKETLIVLLTEYEDVFAWPYADISSIDHEI